MVRTRAQPPREQLAKRTCVGTSSDLLEEPVAPPPSQAPRSESTRWSDAGPSPRKLERRSDGAAAPLACHRHFRPRGKRVLHCATDESQVGLWGGASCGIIGGGRE